MLAVSTVAQIAPKGFEPVTVGTRATTDKETNKKKEIPADQRTRSIIIPELQVDGLPSKFTSLVLDTLRTIAKDQLASMWKAEPMLREVPANVWSVDALLMYAAREAESKRLSTASIAEWFKSSQLAAKLATMDNKDLANIWQSKLEKLSPAVITMNEKDCEAIINTLSKFPDDMESLIGSQLIIKAQKRIATLQAQLAEVSLDEIEV